MLRSVLAGYESFLRIDPRGSAEDLIRVRALVWFCWTIILIQIANMVGMTLSYHAWTEDHMISVMAITILLGIVHGIRYYKNYTMYALSIALLVVSAVLTSASSDHTGVNSALIPVLVLMPMLNGFISGPRVAAATGAMMLFVIILLYYCSVAHDYTGGVSYPVREFQRALQGALAIIMASVVSTVFSTNIFRAFALLEKNIARAREAEAAKSQFLAAMSHELRTPLNGVLGLSEALQKTQLTAEQGQMVSGIDGSGRSLLGILNDILDMVKLGARQVEVKSDAFDLYALIDDVANAWRFSAEEKALLFKVEIDAEAPKHLLGDERHIRQIISKIISNAVKYTNEGRICVLAKIRDNRNEDGVGETMLELVISDTGPGIPEAARKRIFNTFEQAETGAARSQDGAGLGLAICQQLVTLMKGALHFETEFGKGTTFTLSLPVEFAPPVADAVAEESVDDATTSQATGRILVVEDNMINRMVAVKLLENLGYEYETAPDGQKCLECLTTQQFDAILMDHHMPLMDGVEATKAIRAMDDPVSEIPIVACTADAVNGAREALLAVGFDVFLAKPINAEDLLAALLQAMKREPTADKAKAAA